eukprot:TRINITY_DN4100_c0_g1_i1.p1 TRINITY_DN4100_c0_g1~~TRINITY_DN4100_c0_g1_i1.p1  ORF type:complete len:383 (-),score=111.15 TRINITY_DN4100_c0_g1_i1:40-1188(-)
MGCCCCCGGDDGASFTEMMNKPPKVEEVSALMTTLQDKSTPPGKSSMMCCFCFPKALCCCCCCGGGVNATTVKKNELVKASKESFGGGDSFLAHPATVKALSKMFRVGGDGSKAPIKLEYFGTALTLLSVGNIVDKLKALFQAFCGSLDLTLDVLKRMMKSIIDAGVNLAEKIANYVTAIFSGGLVPGGKLVKVAFASINTIIGAKLITHAVKKMIAKMDVDGDGSVSWKEFKKHAMSRSSMFRKFVAWFDRKGKMIRGERSGDQESELIVNGKTYWAFLDVDGEREHINLWKNKEDKFAGLDCDKEISLFEPCKLICPPDESDENTFEIEDLDGKVWEIECMNRNDFFEWTDDLENFCEAPNLDGVDPDDFEKDSKGGCCC